MEERHKMAKALSRLFGLQPAYAGESGQLVVYTPKEDDEKEFAKLNHGKDDYEAALADMDSRLGRVPDTGMKLIAKGGLLFLVLFVGDILRTVWLRRRISFVP